MKLTHVIAIALATAFGIIWCVQIWSAGRWNTALQGEGDTTFFEARKEHEQAASSLQEALETPNPNPVTNATGVSHSSSSGNWLQNVIGQCVAAIKGLGHRNRRQPRLAPPGVYFTLTYLSVRSPSGITGIVPGTQVVCVKDEGPVLLVKFGNVELEVKRQYVTNDLDVAALAARNDARAQQALAAYMAQQQEAIEHQDDTRNTQPP